MSIFIDPDDLFEIKLRILEIGKARVKILDENDEQEGSRILVCQASGRDFDNMSTILENATVINHISGDRLLRMKILCSLIIVRFFKTWGYLNNNNEVEPFMNEKQQLIPITEDTVGKLDDKIVKALAKKWLRETK